MQLGMMGTAPRKAFEHNRWRRWFACGAIALGLVLAVGPITPANAAGPKTTRSKRRQAKRLYDQGRLAYRAGNYEEAILKWQESFRISGHPLIYTSIANAYERLGQYQKALDALRKYRKSAPRREHKTLDARLESLRDRVERDKSEREAAEKARLAQEKALAKEKEAREAAEEKQRKEKQQAQDNAQARWRWIGFPMAGTGLALVATGVSLGALGASKRVDPDSACKSAGNALLCSSDSGEQIRNSNQLAIVGDALWISGTALALGGATFLYFGLRKHSDDGSTKSSDENKTKASMHLLPYAHPSGGGLLVAGQF